MKFVLRSLLTLLVTLTWTKNISGNFPLLDVDTNMRIILVPHDMPIQTTFYRIKATDSDHNFPLSFEVLGSVGKALISLEFLGCSETESLCQANVFLNKPLDVGRTYEFQLRVTDTTGDFTRVKAAISATEGSAYSQTALGPKILTVPENTAIGSKLANFVVVKNELNSRTVLLEIREPEGRIELKQRLLSNNRTECTLILGKKLNFETEPWFTFQLLAMNGHTDISVDTRNVLVSDVVVGVKDIQDTPPIFTSFPSYVEIPPSIHRGDLVTRVHAVDGDTQGKRLIRYGLLADSNPFVAFFDLHPMSGDIHLKRNISELAEMAHPNEHICMSIMAEEIVPPTDSSVPVRYTNEVTRTILNMTLWINQSNSPKQAPMFSSVMYVGEIEENALIGALVRFTLDTKVLNSRPMDQSITLCLEESEPNTHVQRSAGNGHGAFYVTPEEGYGNFTFEIRVARSELLDFEEKTVFRLKIRASTVGSFKSTSEIEIHVRDENDCKPIFGKKEYYVELPENSPPGTSLVHVHATDCDTARAYGKLVYAQLAGSEAFHLNQITGELSVDNPNLLDRETQSEIRFYVTATDGGFVDPNSVSHTISSVHNVGVAMVIVKLQDVNDSPPVFEPKNYQAVLTPELDGLKWPLQVKATDADFSGTPNAQIRYQVVGGDSHFSVDSITGDMRVKSPFRLPPSGGPLVGSVRVKAYDLGSPSLSSETVVEVFSQDVLSQDIQFLFPSSVERVKEHQGKIAEMLSSLLGGQATIKGIHPYERHTSTVRHLRLQKAKAEGTENEENAQNREAETEQQRKDPADSYAGEKTVVTTRVHSPLSGKSRVIDLELLRTFMIIDDNLPTTPKPEQPAEIITGGSQSLFWILICLIVLLLILFLIFLLCIFCPCCLYNRSNLRSRSSKSKIEKITKTRRESEREVEVKDSQVQKSNVPVRKHVSTILENGDDYHLGPNRFPREAWSGDEREMRRGRTRIHQEPRTPQFHPAKQRLQLQRQEISFEDWEQEQQPRRTETLPAQFVNRADARDEIGTRWMQQQQLRRGVESYAGGGSRIGVLEDGKIGHAQIRRNEDTEQYFPDRISEHGGGNYGYHTSERRMIPQYSPLRSPPHSLPPAPPTAEYRIHSERHPQQRFYRTDVGEVLQFDFDGDEGKEMLLRRFIHDQKQPREHEIRPSNLETNAPAAYARVDLEKLPIRKKNHGDGNQRHTLGVEPTSYEKDRRPKAAAGSRRHLLSSMEIPELVEEDEAPHQLHHVDEKPRHRKEKGKKHLTHRHQESRETKTHSKSKDRSRSRETDDGVEEGNTGRKHKSESPSCSRENSKSPLPQVTIDDEHVQSRDQSYSQSKSIRSKQSNEKFDSSVPARRSFSPVLLSRKIKMEETIEGRPVRDGSEDLNIGNQMIGNLLIPDDLDGILKEEDGEDSGIGIVGMAQRSKMLEKKSVFTIAYDEMTTQNVLRPDTAANNGS